MSVPCAPVITPSSSSPGCHINNSPWQPSTPNLKINESKRNKDNQEIKPAKCKKDPRTALNDLQKTKQQAITKKQSNQMQTKGSTKNQIKKPLVSNKNHPRNQAVTKSPQISIRANTNPRQQPKKPNPRQQPISSTTQEIKP